MTRDRERRERAGSARRDANIGSGSGLSTLNLPEGLDLWRPKVGVYRMDVLLFKAGEGNLGAEPGKWYYERTFWVHGGVGPDNLSYVCPAKTLKQRCPICERRAVLARDPDSDPDQLKALRPRQRQMFLLHVVGKDEEDEGKIVLYEASFKAFGELLDEIRRNADDDETHIIDFDDPERGSVLKVAFHEQDIGMSKPWIKCYRIEFKARTKPLSEELLEHGYCLDNMVRVLPYDELKRIYFQEPEVEEGKSKAAVEDDWDEPPPKRAEKQEKKKPEPDDDWDEPPPKKAEKKPEPEKEPERRIEPVKFKVGDRIRHRRLGPCKVVKVSPDGTSLAEKDAEGEVHRPVDVNDCRPLEAAKSDPTAGSSKSASGAEKSTGQAPSGVGKTTSHSEPDDDWDEPPPKKAPAKEKATKSDDDWD